MCGCVWIAGGPQAGRRNGSALPARPAEANSVRVEAAVSPPPGCSAGDLAGELHRSQTLARGIAIGIEGLGGLRAVLGGPVGIHRVSVSSRAGDDPRAVLERHQELQEAYSHLQQDRPGAPPRHRVDLRSPLPPRYFCLPCRPLRIPPSSSSPAALDLPAQSA